MKPAFPVKVAAVPLFCHPDRLRLTIAPSLEVPGPKRGVYLKEGTIRVRPSQSHGHLRLIPVNTTIPAGVFLIYLNHTSFIPLEESGTFTSTDMLRQIQAAGISQALSRKIATWRASPIRVVLGQSEEAEGGS